MKRALLIAMASAVLLASAANAGSITISEPGEGPPVVTIVGMEAPVSTALPEFASASGIIRPATSPAPLAPGITYVVLTEPGVTQAVISDIIRLTASQILTDAGGQFQTILVEFYSDEAPGFSQIVVTPGSPLIPETGGLQDITAALGIQFPNQNVQVFVSSDAVEVPEPGILALLGMGLANMGGYGWRRRMRVAA